MKINKIKDFKKSTQLLIWISLTATLTALAYSLASALYNSDTTLCAILAAISVIAYVLLLNTLLYKITKTVKAKDNDDVTISFKGKKYKLALGNLKPENEEDFLTLYKLKNKDTDFRFLFNAFSTLALEWDAYYEIEYAKKNEPNNAYDKMDSLKAARGLLYYLCEQDKDQSCSYLPSFIKSQNQVLEDYKINPERYKKEN